MQRKISRKLLSPNKNFVKPLGRPVTLSKVLYGLENSGGGRAGPIARPQQGICHLGERTISKDSHGVDSVARLPGPFSLGANSISTHTLRLRARTQSEIGKRSRVVFVHLSRSMEWSASNICRLIRRSNCSVVTVSRNTPCPVVPSVYVFRISF